MTFISADQILDLDIPVRADRFEFDLLNIDHQQIGVLDVNADSSPTVSVNAQQSASRSLSGVQISGSDLSFIDTLTNRVAPQIVLQNGDRFPLGIFMFGQDNEAPFSWGVTKTPELTDETFIVDRALEQTASLPTGGSVVGLIAALLSPIYLPSGTVIETADQVAGSPLVYRVGSGRYAALSALAALIGCYPPFFDNEGVFRFKRIPDPNDLTIDHVYESGGRILDGTITTSSTLYKAPNRYLVIGDNPDTPVVGQYDLPPSAPHSSARTGNVVVTQRNVQGLVDQAIADLAAYVDALTDHTTYGTIQFSSTADPRHDTLDRMAVLGTPYLETGWSLQCSSGGQMTHSGTVLWR